MRKSLVTIAVLGTLALPTAVFAADAAPAAAPAPAYTVSYNVGLFSQYIFRGLTQTDKKPALQGGVDFSHASGLYVGAWGSNISWLEDGAYYDNSSLELDVYGGYRNTIGETGLGYDFGVLQYIYPGHKLSATTTANTTELYGALSYKWLQAKFSSVVSDDAFNNEDGAGTYYAELNANIPLADSGITANLHIGRQKFDGNALDVLYTYTDWKIGATKSFANGVNVGAFYADTDAKDRAGYAAYAGGPIDGSTFTAFVQKTF
ncbi:Conserved hypothetical protein CHP02001 [Methylophilaceae bacterium]